MIYIFISCGRLWKRIIKKFVLELFMHNIVQTYACIWKL